MGPEGDVAIRKSGKGKLDILADVLTVTKSLVFSSEEKMKIDGLPLRDYITKVILAELQKSGPPELLVHVTRLCDSCIRRLYPTDVMKGVHDISVH